MGDARLRCRFDMGNMFGSLFGDMGNMGGTLSFTRWLDSLVEQHAKPAL